mmetsp:Transcript_12993/g.58630  ORF Transcript_12993/g.58630 Transcript_12993/m.58630 type:complete len:215 (-) Transcript_12993:2090-2734(-)
MHVDVDEEIHEVPRARSGRLLLDRDGSNELPGPSAAEQFLRHQSAAPQPLEVFRVLPAKELEPVRLRQRREPGAVNAEEAVHRRDPALSAHAASHRPGVVDDRLPEYDPDHHPPHVPRHPRELVDNLKKRVALEAQDDAVTERYRGCARVGQAHRGGLVYSLHPEQGAGLLYHSPVRHEALLHYEQAVSLHRVGHEVLVRRQHQARQVRREQPG